MSESLYNYVGSPNSNLICCICRMPFTDPTTTCTCAHTFCRDCILLAIEHSAQCPVDRSPLTPDCLAPAHPIVRSLVDELVVECVHRAEGCMYTCQRQFLPFHLIDSCAYREVSCPQGKCQETMAYKDTPLHIHGKEEGSKMGNEDSGEAGDSQIYNPSVINALEAEIQSQDAICSPCPTHSDECTPRSTKLPPTAISADSRIVDNRIAALSEQNILLRHKIDRLEGLLDNFRREMGTVKRVLEPWFRVSNGAGTSGGYPSIGIPTATRSLNTTSDSEQNTHIASDNLPTDTHSPSQRYPFLSTAAGQMSSTDSLAPYFPPELEGPSSLSQAQPSLASNTHGYRHRLSSSIDFTNVSQQDPYIFLPQQTPMVAPLNLSTTLEGTLHGLRESVVGLAASVDSMGRRHDIALTNETMRMGEEIGGLRAGIHGLRMQVHAIMMDRNAQITGHDGVGGGGGQWLAPPIPLPQPRIYQQPSITKL